jgi:CubicO group peptidase (beta-lactamase class C family)
MRHLRISVAAAVVAGIMSYAAGVRPHAQGLSSSLFERYVDALRQEYRIPGMSVVVLQNGSPIVRSGFGHADVAQSIRANDDTPYPIANLTEVVGSAIVLQQCIDYGHAELSDRVIRWTPFPDPGAQLQHLLGHVSSSGSYAYDPARFSVLGEAAGECAGKSYPELVADTLERFGMMRSIPGREGLDGSTFSGSRDARYRSVAGQLAVPYRIANGSPARSDYTPTSVTAANGLISTALDLAEFDKALDSGLALSSDLRGAAWPRGSGRPTGLGWFVQDYGDLQLVWHFGGVKDAYSSLILKVPSRRLTLIMLANSDRLATPFSTSRPDVTQSVFARTFLRLFVD